METDFPTIGFFKIDINTDKDANFKFDKTLVPFFKVFKNDKEIDSFKGADEDKVRQKLIAFSNGTWNKVKFTDIVRYMKTFLDFVSSILQKFLWLYLFWSACRHIIKPFY